MSARKLATLTYRGLQLTFLGLIIAHFALDLGYPWWWNFLPIVLAYALVIVANRWGGTPDSPRAAREPVEVDPPVTGRWTALNSPADRTPSHGTHAYGQTFAIDVVAEPEPGADATVVRATDVQRDHLSRTSPLALLYLMLVEASVRDLLGAKRIVGNHVVLDLGDGTYALYAHLRRGSLTVREGDRVTAGQPLARCGNSGNSTEPHLHFQLMDGPDPDSARGVPFTWRGIGVPRNHEAFEAPTTASQPA